MTSALKVLTTACHSEPAMNSEAAYTLRGKATLSGVTFCELVHGQGWLATNGIELHPVLTFTASSCSRVTNP
jgi:hypothetical protein